MSEAYDNLPKGTNSVGDSSFVLDSGINPLLVGDSQGQFRIQLRPRLCVVNRSDRNFGEGSAMNL